MTQDTRGPSIPRDKADNFTQGAIQSRLDFIQAQTGTALKHVPQTSQDPAQLPGNLENPIGAAQVPLGLAGPIRINGEHAQGDFYVPLATTEGTLVASYSRGMRILSEAGGVKTTVVERYMQRAPVFHFADARAARAFRDWFKANWLEIKAAAESTTRSGKLSHVEHYGLAKMHYTRFNYTTGDAAGQNMCGKATDAACKWIMAHYEADIRYTLSGAIDTDKKHSQLNTIHSRGARVVAEVTLPRDLVLKMTRADTRDLYRARQVSMMGGMHAGTSNNGVHAANALAAIFIATGQDAANVAESQAGLTYVELLENGDLYWSITLPSLIVATYGGGTGLATQRECLEMLDCYGSGKVAKFCEIVAGTVLAGEISLATAVVSDEWVESHDAHGRNRP
ncbi:hydroxymethylglutaryl-CoA reductase [Litorimonas sp. WD9-15]|uniref:hydroxymethylglutaryl-CoA reductase n=1 Tax=Litorimonas sp. WD9-15 TaxID=3418716 RepID=UPI003D031B42